MRNLTAAERLIVAADFKPGPDGRQGVVRDVVALAEELKGTGVCLKVNSALRARGYDLIDILHSYNVRVFADLKLNDISETMTTDGMLLREVSPDIVTAMCSSGIAGMKALKAELPNTDVLGVTVFTSLKDADSQAMFSCSTNDAVLRFGKLAADADLDGLISSPAEVEMLKAEVSVMMSFNTPGIRPAWSIVEGDDQNPERIMTPTKAIKAGADRLVIGRPILRAENRRDAVMRTIAEIEEATDD